MITLSFSSGPTISIVSPHSGDVWYKGKTYTIKWVLSGKMDTEVKITLYKPDHQTLQAVIKKPTGNDGSYKWKVPSSIPNGKYVIRVKTMDNLVHDDSDVFTITSVPLSSGTLTVTNPHSGDTWYRGLSYTIRWTKSGTLDSQVKITLYKPDHKTLQAVIIKPTGNNNSYTWKIPASIPDGKYVIRVKTMDNAVHDDSDVFEIASRGFIKVINPLPGACWAKGSRYTIKWTKSGYTDHYVKILLYKPDLKTLQKTIKIRTYNDRASWWKVPVSIPDGEYVIKIQTLDNLAYDYSDVFSISKSCLNVNEVKLDDISREMADIPLSLELRGKYVAIEGVEGIRKVLEKYQIKSSVRIKLIAGERTIFDSGAISPVIRSGKVLFSYLSDAFLSFNLDPAEIDIDPLVAKEIIESYPEDLRIVVISEGKELGKIPLRR